MFVTDINAFWTCILWVLTVTLWGFTLTLIECLTKRWQLFLSTSPGGAMFMFILCVSFTFYMLSGPQIIFLPFLLFSSLFFQKDGEDESSVITGGSIKLSKQPIPFNPQQKKLAKNLQLLHGKKEGAMQLALLMKKNNNYKSIVSEINFIDETSFFQHQNTKDNLVLSVHNNLKQYYLIMKGIESIDYHHLKKSVQKQNAQTELNTEAIQQRLSIWQTQKDLADDLLILNEIELTKIDLLTAQVANLKSSQTTKTGGIESMLKTLDELSQKNRSAVN